MFSIIKKWCFILVIVIWTACSFDNPDSMTSLVDATATTETEALYHYLEDIKGKNALFGHQATLAYGYSWRSDSSRSDVKDVTGSFPALYGWDLADFIPQPNYTKYENEDRWNRILGYSKDGLERGGILTFSWHMRNPVTQESFYDTTSAVHTIIPGGELHQEYMETLDLVADFMEKLSPYPVIIRPFHEHNGDWFWWGKGHSSEQDYIALWRFTVEYLRDQKEMNNLIYAFSPDRSRTNIETFKKDYVYGYPGDEYVDIIGLDNYWDVGHPVNTKSKEEQASDFAKSLTMTAQIADSLGKIAAITETGLERIPDPTFWTETLLKAMTLNEWTKQFTYVQVWRNATQQEGRPDHYYAPFPGQISAEDFIKFKETEFILFEDELPDIYIHH